MFGTLLAFLALAMALGFGSAGGKGDILRTATDQTQLGDWKVGTAADVRSGRVVKRSAAGKIAVAGADEKSWLGVVRYRVKQDADPKAHSPKFDRAADFAADDVLQVISGAGTVVEVEIATGNNTTAGEILKTAAAGKVAKFATTPTVTDLQAAVCKTLEDMDATSADKWVLAELLR